MAYGWRLSSSINFACPANVKTSCQCALAVGIVCVLFLVGAKLFEDYDSFQPARLSEVSRLRFKPTYIKDVFNLTDTRLELEPRNSTGFCSLELLIIVASSPSNFRQRSSVRMTWGARHDLARHAASIVFFLGRGQHISGPIEAVLREEQSKYGDLVQEKFLDTYRNLTVKSIAMLKWLSQTCNFTGYPKYVMKTDDDMYINVQHLVDILDNNVEPEMLGRIACGGQLSRDNTSKYYTSPMANPTERLPCYLSGTGYVLKGNIIKRLLRASLHTPIIPAEDMYITGLLRVRIQAMARGFPRFCCASKELVDPCDVQNLVTIHAVSPRRMRYFSGVLEKNLTCGKELSQESICQYELFNPTSYNE